MTNKELDELEKICRPREPSESPPVYLKRWALRASMVPMLIAEIRRLREALEFYANRKNWEVPTRTAPVTLDEGRKARDILEGK